MQYARGISYICPNRPTTGFGNVDIRIASVSKRQNCYLFPFIYLKSVFFFVSIKLCLTIPGGFIVATKIVFHTFCKIAFI